MELDGGRGLKAPPPSSKDTNEQKGATGAVTPESRCARDARSAQLDDAEQSATAGPGPAKGDWAGGTQVELRELLRAGHEPASLLSKRLSHEAAGQLDFTFARDLLVVTFEHVLARQALYSPKRWDGRLRAALEQFDRHAARSGAGVAELIEWMELHAIAFREGLADPHARRRSQLGVPAAPRSLALYVTELERQLHAPDAKLDRRTKRWRAYIERLAAHHDVPDELRSAFDEALARELGRRGEGRWCRVRRAARQAIDKVDGVRAQQGFKPLRHELYGADNPRWRRDWSNW